METLSNIFLGFSVVLQPINLFFAFVGCVLGTLVGVLPGIGPAAGISILLPSTFKLAPVTGIIMLAGIYYGAMYGGSTTSILVNVPGEAASVVTCLDGYQMARQGRAGPALGISAIGSFIAGTFGVVMLMFLAPPLGNIAIKLGPPEYFSLMVLGLTLLIYLSKGSVLKALIMGVAGLFVGSIGMDPVSGEHRFTYGVDTLMDGVGLVPVVMGLFGVAEVLSNLETLVKKREVFETKIRNLLPDRQERKRSRWPIIRGSVLGFFIGIIPGPSTVIASFSSYAAEKAISPHPEKFGSGVIEGVAGPESANNSATCGAFIPLFSLGIPTNAVMALYLGALMIHGVQPGPLFISQNPKLFWGVITSMYIGNAMLLILNLPLIGLWVRLLRVPYMILFPLILLFSLIGVYALNGNPVEIFIMILFGLIGYLMRKFDYEGAPFILALVLGPMLETNLRQALLISDGRLTVFFSRPVSGIFLVTALITLVIACLPWMKRKKKEIGIEDKEGA